MKAEELLTIGDLFDELGWPTDVDPTSQFPNLFENYCKMYNRLSEPHRKITLSLTRTYAWIRYPTTIELFLAAWSRFIPLLPISVHEVVMAPLPRDLEYLRRARPKWVIPKSSDFMHYLAHGYEDNLRWQLKGRNLRLMPFEKVVEVGIGAGTALALIDDYVGSGNTINRALSLLKNNNIATKNVYIVTSLAQASGISKLMKCGCKLTTARVLRRGITDNAQIKAKSQALELIDEIGSYLTMPKDYWRGYEDTEALVTLMRTPNNTFPVFWTNKSVDGVVWDAPFTRHKHD